METYEESQQNSLNMTELPASILLQVDSLVRAIVQPENAKAKLMSGTCGLKWQESFAKLNHHGWSRKMFEEFSLWTGESCSETFSETWPTWGIVLDGVAGGLVTLERHTKETEFLSWPTPRANDAEKRGMIGDDPRNGLPAAVLYHVG